MYVTGVGHRVIQFVFSHRNNSLTRFLFLMTEQGQISGVLLDAYNDEEAVAFERLESLKYGMLNGLVLQRGCAFS